MPTTHNFILCPKCQKQMMGKSHLPALGKEYFAHCCHVYFGLVELVEVYGYDAGDLNGGYVLDAKKYVNGLVNKFYPKLASYPPIISNSEFDSGEPLWATGYERVDAYQMVARMFSGIQEWDDLTDLANAQMNALQIGVQ